MRRIPISELSPGISFTKQVFLDKDTVLVAAEQPITKQDIDRLNQFRIAFVLTDGEPVVQKDKDDTLNENKRLLGSELPLLRTDETNKFYREVLEQGLNSKQEFSGLYSNAFELVQKCYRLVAEGKNFEIREFREIIEKMVEFIKSKSNLPIVLLSHSTSGYYLFNHVVISTWFSLYLGNLLEYSRPKLVDLAFAAFFADIGMALIPEDVSEKKQPLDDADWKVLKKHPILGYQVLTQKLKLKNNLALVALQHQEALDGTGYPQKLVANQIDELTKVYTIADNFSAMIQARPHRPALLPYEAMRSLISVNVSKYDLKIVRVFLNKLTMFPVGSAVMLSDNRIGMVLFPNDGKPLRPIIRITRDINGKNNKVLEFVDLIKEVNLFIQKALPKEQLFSS